MVEVAIPWLNHGKPIEVSRRIPINGERQIQALGLDYLDAQTNLTNAQVAQMMGLLVGAKEVLKKSGVEEAKKVFDHNITRFVSKAVANKEFLWEEEVFEKSLDAWLDDFVYRQLDVDNFPDARKALTKKVEDLNDALSDQQGKIMDFQHRMQLLSIYWRLKKTGVKELTPPGEEPIPLSWRREDMEATLDILGDYYDPETDGQAIQDALHKDDPPSAELDMKNLKFVDGKAMRGKSETASEDSTESSGTSTDSSAPPTETATKSEK